MGNGEIDNSSDIFSIHSDNPLQTYNDISGDLQNCETYNYEIRTHLCGSSIISDNISQLKTVDIVDSTWVDQHSQNNTQKQLFASKGKFTDRVELSWENNNNAYISHFEIQRRELTMDDSEDFDKISESSTDNHFFIDYHRRSKQTL